MPKEIGKEGFLINEKHVLLKFYGAVAVRSCHKAFCALAKKISLKFLPVFLKFRNFFKAKTKRQPESAVKWGVAPHPQHCFKVKKTTLQFERPI